MLFGDYVSCYAHNSYPTRPKRPAFNEPRVSEPTALSAGSTGSLPAATAAAAAAATETAAPKQLEHGPGELGAKPSSNAADV
jgi:hypothetical protein